MPGAHDLVNARVTHACAHVSAARGGACIVEEHMCAQVQACTCIFSATIHAPQRVPGTVPADCTRVCKYTHNGNDTKFGLAKALACFKFRGLQRPLHVQNPFACLKGALSTCVTTWA